MSQPRKPQEPYSGLALVTAFVLIAVFLLLFPEHLNYPLLAYGLSGLFMFIGSVGFIVEVRNLAGPIKLKGWLDLGVGLGLIQTWIILGYALNLYLIVKLLMLLVLLLGLYALALGAIKFAISIANSGEYSKTLLFGIAGAIAGIVGFISSVLGIVSYLQSS